MRRCRISGSGRSPGGGMAAHSSTLAWRIPWTEESGGLQSTGSQRVRRDWETERTHARIKCSLKFSYSQVALVVKKEVSLPIQEMQEAWVRSLGREDPLEHAMAIHSSILAWKIIWTEEPGGLHGVAKRWTQPSTHTQTHTTYLWNLKYDMNELMYKATDSQTQRTDLWLLRGRGGRGVDWELGLANAKQHK